MVWRETLAESPQPPSATSLARTAPITSGPVESGGSHTGGDLPDDPEGRDRDEVESPQRGWLPPEDRLWRHPSEVARLGLPEPLPPLLGGGSAHRRHAVTRRSSLVAGVMGAAALATTVAVVLTIVDTETNSTLVRARSVEGSAPITASTTAMTSKTDMTTVIGRDVTQLVDSIRPSLVDLQSPDANANAHWTGVVLPGGLVVTAASAVAGASQLDVVTSDGKRHRGQVIGSDAHAGVAVIGTDVEGAPAATFADEIVEPDDLVVAACLCTSQHSPSNPPVAAVGMVRRVGTGVALEGGPPLVNAIEAEMPVGQTSRGGVLLDGRGHVIGILDGQMSEGDDTIGVFVPAPLAEGVALELAQNHHVAHGWLGVVCSDDLGGGASVAAVMSGGPAQRAGLQPGDVVVAVGPHPVGSVADLQERLYVMPPGADAELVIERGTASMIMTVKLASSPGD
jgi:S1-C subfamily serine protease